MLRARWGVEQCTARIVRLYKSCGPLLSSSSWTAGRQVGEKLQRRAEFDVPVVGRTKADVSDAAQELRRTPTATGPRIDHAAERDTSLDSGAQFRHLEHGRSMSGGALVSKLRALRTKKGPGYTRVALGVIEAARQGGTASLAAYNSVLQMLSVDRTSAMNNVEIMEGLVCQLREDGFEPDLQTYNSIIYIYGQARETEKAQRAYDQMAASAIEPRPVTLSNLIIAQSWGSPAAVYSTLVDMDERGWETTRGANLRLIAAMWQRKDTTGVGKIMRRMLDNDQAPTESAYAVGLMSAGRMADADLAQQLFARRTADGFDPKEEIYASMMVAYSKSGRHSDCLGFWRQLVCLDGIGQVKINWETFHCALKSAVIECEWEEVDAILDMMKARRMTPVEQTFKTAIAACKMQNGTSKLSQLQRLDKVADAITRRGGKVSAHVKMLFAMACVQAKEWDRAALLFENVMARKRVVWASAWDGLFRTLLMQERCSDLKRAWVRSKTEGEAPTMKGCELAMTAAQRLADPEWALELLATGQAMRKKCSPTMHRIAIGILAEAGRLDEARDVFQEWRACGPISFNHRALAHVLAACDRHGRTDVALTFLEASQARQKPHRLLPSNMAMIIASLRHHGRAGEVIPLFEAQLSLGYQPNSGCFALVAEAASEAGDTTNATRYREESRRLGRDGNEETATARVMGQAEGALAAAEGLASTPAGLLTEQATTLSGERTRLKRVLEDKTARCCYTAPDEAKTR